MASNQIMFILFSAMIIVFSILTVTTRKILRAAVYLLFVLVADPLCWWYCRSYHLLYPSHKSY